MYFKKIILLLVLLLNFIHLYGCATIVSGTSQNIAVSSIPGGATVTVEPGDHQTVTPANLELERDGGPYRITISHEGYEPFKVKLTTSKNGWMWGNLLLGGLLGLIVDSSTGAGIKLSPEEVNANLIKAGIQPQSSSEDKINFFTTDNELLGQIIMN